MRARGDSGYWQGVCQRLWRRYVDLSRRVAAAGDTESADRYLTRALQLSPEAAGEAMEAAIRQAFGAREWERLGRLMTHRDGFQAGDILRTIEGESVTGTAQLKKFVERIESRELSQIEIEFVRDGRTQHRTMRFGRTRKD